MADCKFCGTYVVDDSSAGMDLDHRIYHPKCEPKATERRNTVKWAKHYIDSIDIDLEDKRYGQALIRIRELSNLIEDLYLDNFRGVR